ncbi:hypothetical protein CJF32_00005425 [Rutstroemia sp. NJR-2017a WRK4]|nr:hypothetical protein CJF32_00005425 [Rutstroemia sp. NJR-2017a WRK4]
MFRVVVDDFDDIYIIIDGLDECPKTDSERARLLDIIKDIRNWNIPSMHIFVASRQERDILDEFDTFASTDHVRIPADGNQVRKDIELFIQKKLSEDKRCSRWKPALKAFVQERISTRAGGIIDDRLMDCNLLLEMIPAGLGPADMYSIDENLVDKAMVKCCFRYLTHIGHCRPQIDGRLVYQFPLLYYSSKFLAHHLEKLEAQVRDPEVDDLMLEFFDTGKTDAWRVWMSVALVASSSSLMTSDRVYLNRWHQDLRKNNPWNIVKQDLPHPISWLSSLGLAEALKQALPALPPLTLDSIPQMDKGFGSLGLPLFEASRRGCPKTVSVLLDAGADINTGLGTRRLALMAAVNHGSGFVKFLLDRGATVNAENCRLPWHDSPLRRACEDGDLEVVKLLLDSGADPNFVANDHLYHNVPLAIAVSNEFPDLVKLLLAYGANPNYVSKDKAFPTALHVAVESGESVELIRLLLEAGASQNLVPRGTDTPFHLAASSDFRSPPESIEVMKLLLEYGADPSKRGEYMRTPLISAVAEHSSNEVLKFLLGLNIDIHAVSTRGNALTTAIKSCQSTESLRDYYPTVVTILLEAGAYQCADLHWQRAYNLARQLRDGPDDSEDDIWSENRSMYDSDIDLGSDYTGNRMSDWFGSKISSYDSDTDDEDHMREKEMIFDLMKQYDAKRNAEVVEKMEEIVSDVARLFTRD